jgi:hypothetical protein
LAIDGEKTDKILAIEEDNQNDNHNKEEQANEEAVVIKSPFFISQIEDI